MKQNFKIYFFITISFLLSSCKCEDCDYNYLLYRIENKLDSPIQIRFVSNNFPSKNIETIINSNETKDVISGETGLEGFGLISVGRRIPKTHAL